MEDKNPFVELLNEVKEARKEIAELKEKIIQHNGQLENDIMSMDEACQFLGLKKSTLYLMTSARTIPFSKVNNKKIYFSRAALEEWVKSSQRKMKK